MSKTTYVDYGKQGFWAYDVALGVFLKYLIDAAEASTEASKPWLKRAVKRWRLGACIQDFGFTPDPKWSFGQLQSFIALAEQACVDLAGRESITAAEIASWPMVDDQRIHTRGSTEVHTTPVVELGRAIIALVNGSLPDPPKGQIWLYGTPEGCQTIGGNG